MLQKTSASVTATCSLEMTNTGALGSDMEVSSMTPQPVAQDKGYCPCKWYIYITVGVTDIAGNLLVMGVLLFPYTCSSTQII